MTKCGGTTNNRHACVPLLFSGGHRLQHLGRRQRCSRRKRPQDCFRAPSQHASCQLPVDDRAWELESGSARLWVLSGELPTIPPLQSDRPRKLHVCKWRGVALFEDGVRFWFAAAVCSLVCAVASTGVHEHPPVTTGRPLLHRPGTAPLPVVLRVSQHRLGYMHVS